MPESAQLYWVIFLGTIQQINGFEFSYRDGFQNAPKTCPEFWLPETIPEVLIQSMGVLLSTKLLLALKRRLF